jgi:deoxycytidine triphosphate deaminase
VAPNPPPAGLLSDGAIAAVAAKKELIVSNFSKSCLRGAAYNVRIAKDGIVTPDGELYLPSHLPDGRKFSGPIILHPGETAELSSFETFHLPDLIAGNISIKTELASKGLLLLSGLLIDPGYGISAEQFEREKQHDGRLHFYIANLGTAPVALIPQDTHFATVQFLRVNGEIHEDRKAPAQRTAEEWAQRPAMSLGFISDLLELKEQHKKMRQESARTAEMTKNLIVLGYFLLAATILGLTLNNLLSIGADDDLVDKVATAVPDQWEGKALIAALAFAVAFTAYSVALAFRGKPEHPANGTSGASFYQQEARHELRLKRWSKLALFAGWPFVAVATGIVWVVHEYDYGAEPWLAPTGIAFVLAMCVWLTTRFLWRPITDKAVRERAAGLKSTAEPRRRGARRRR